MSRASARTGLAVQLIVAWVRTGKHHLTHDSRLNEHVVRGAYDLAEAFCVEAERRAEEERAGQKPQQPDGTVCMCPVRAEPHVHRGIRIVTAYSPEDVP